MKAFQTLAQYVGKWRRSRHSPNSAREDSASISPKLIANPNTAFNRIHCSRRLQKIHAPLMLGITVTALTSVVGYRFYNQPQLSPGTISPATFYAPKNGSFSDPKTTEEMRREAQAGIVPIWQRDQTVTNQILATLTETLTQIDRLRQLSDPVPWFDNQRLSSNIQRYLQTTTEDNWQNILDAVNTPNIKTVSPSAQINQAIAQLRQYRAQTSPADWQILVDNIEEIRNRYQKFAEELISIPPERRQAMLALLEFSEEDWQESRKQLQETSQQILKLGIPPGMPSSLLKDALRYALKSIEPPAAKTAAIDLFLVVQQGKTNLTVDREATKNRAEQAAKAVQPVVVTVQRGQKIANAGETITQKQFVLLDGFGLSRRAVNWVGLGASAIGVLLAVGVFYGMERRLHRPLRRRDHLLICLLSLSAPLIAITDLSVINLSALAFLNLPAIGFLSSCFYGPTLGVTQVVLSAALSGFAAASPNWEYLLASTAGGLMAAAVAGRLRSRDELAFLGVGIGVMQGGVYFVVQLISSAAAGTIWYAILPGAAIYGFLGFTWSVVALGLSPYLERLFDVTTPIRLVELSNPNSPLLKKLATEAPGTFQHTLFVACLAEAAARELHCNVELIRAGTLYHDIGKMHDSMAFIENQMGGPNKHDQINDPHKSADIIKRHVSEGLVMAKKYGLPRVIQDFIPEHQGTLLIAYFFHRAKQSLEAKQASAESIDQALSVDDFSYDGPIPQSRETGIVMLADGCEAALRSLRDATPKVASSTVQKIFKARWHDGQLRDSGIAYEELPVIAEIFVRVWQQFHHQRIAYPKAALEVSRNHTKST